MIRPDEGFRLSTPVSLAIVVVFGIAGVLLGRSALRMAAAGPSGYEGYSWFLQLLFAGAALLVATLALYFARNRFLYWVGLVSMFALLAL